MSERSDKSIHFKVASTKAGNQSVSDWVTQELKRTIAAGDLAPGDRLPGERQLSEALSVSRVSVRAALQKLKAQGLVSSVQGGGTRVIASSAQLDSPLAGLVIGNSDNLEDLIDLRTQLVLWSARRCLSAMERDDLRTLEELVNSMQGCAQPAKLNTLDLKFHGVLAKSSASAVYLHLVSIIDEILTSALLEHESHRPLGVQDAGFFSAQDQAILTAIKAGDLDKLEALLLHHAHYRKDLMLSRADNSTTGTFGQATQAAE